MHAAVRSPAPHHPGETGRRAGTRRGRQSRQRNVALLRRSTLTLVRLRSLVPPAGLRLLVRCTAMASRSTRWRSAASGCQRARSDPIGALCDCSFRGHVKLSISPSASRASLDGTARPALLQEWAWARANHLVVYADDVGSCHGPYGPVPRVQRVRMEVERQAGERITPTTSPATRCRLFRAGTRLALAVMSQIRGGQDARRT